MLFVSQLDSHKSLRPDIGSAVMGQPITPAIYDQSGVFPGMLTDQ